MHNKLPSKMVSSERNINISFPDNSQFDKEIMGLIKGAMIIAPMITAGLFANRPSVAIIVDAVIMKKKGRSGDEPFFSTTSSSSCGHGTSTRYTQPKSHLKIDDDIFIFVLLSYAMHVNFFLLASRNIYFTFILPK